ncbi:MAG: hypothetical protein HC875_17020 [Anaerolineales bacterium]|nr:hypothetical protein [Anaerolineales bacterium]
MKHLVKSIPLILGLLLLTPSRALAQSPYWDTASPWEDICDSSLRHQVPLVGFAFNPPVPTGDSPFKALNRFPLEWTDQGCSWALLPGYGSDIDPSGNLYRPPVSYFEEIAPSGVMAVKFGFYARSDTPTTLGIELSYADENFVVKTLFEDVDVTESWQYFSFEKYNLDLWANGDKRITAFYPTLDISSVWVDAVQVDYLHVEGFVPVISPTPTRTPIPYTPTATATARPTLWATPTSISTPAPGVTITPVTPISTKQLPAKYSFVPTSIPAVKLPSWPPVATMAPIATPATPISLALIPTPGFPSHSWVPAPGEPTPTPLAWTTDVVSFTSWLSASTSINGTDTFTVASAPGWYAPSLPRPLADVGWTFETMQGGIATGQRYSLAAWAALAGYLASLPIQLIKSVMDVFRFMGPFGLFVGWLLIMLPGVLFFKVFEFFKSLVIRLFNFIFDMIRFILELIKLIPFV